MLKHLSWTLVLLLLAGNAHSAGLGGTVYVPNLHAKCLSSHQKRLLECAMVDTTPEVTPTDLDCADDSLAEYRQCEANIEKLRKLDDLRPIQPKVYDTSAILKALEEAEHGGYPD